MLCGWSLHVIGTMHYMHYSQINYTRNRQTVVVMTVVHRKSNYLHQSPLDFSISRCSLRKTPATYKNGCYAGLTYKS